MKHSAYLFATLPFLLWVNSAFATPLAGEAIVYSEGLPVVVSPITGDLDTASNTMSVDPFEFFGYPFITSSVELLGTGTYTRTDNFNGTTTATVNPGQLGAYVHMDWNFNLGMGTFMVWDISPSADGGAYTPVDSDGDGSPGHAFVSGPFVGATMVYSFTAGEPPPGINITLGVAGGTTQECSETGGSAVGLTATVTLVGGAELGSIDWFVNNESAGSGETITTFLALGSHTVDVVATAITGESGIDSVSLEVKDTTPPDLEVAFLDQAGNVVTSISAGNHVTARLVPTDICDPAPTAEGAAVPVFEVADGDAIKLQGDKIKLPTTAIELSGSTTDASGNSRNGMAVLSITD